MHVSRLGRFAVLVGLAVAGSSFGASILIDHRHTDITTLTATRINRAKSLLHIAYGHTSHGSQITDGMTGLVGFANGGGRGLALPHDIFAWNNGGAGGALDLHDYAMDGDVGYYPDWVNNTRAYLNHPANADVNVVVWSWCGQMGGKYASGTLLSEYLQPMAALEQEYPGVVFVYMTGHVDIWDDANNKAACQVVRNWCSTGNRVLYDFNDIERYDPDGTYFPYVDDNCTIYASAGGAAIGNWATAWQGSHAQGVDWYDCGSAHSQPLNANQKAYAAWTLWCQIAERIQPPAWDDGYRALGGGWRRLGWFGDYVPMGSDGWVWHNKHGFWYPARGSTPQSIWFFSQDMGWLWTSATVYPFLYRQAPAGWLWYNGSRNPRWFRNFATGRWESRP